MVEVESESPAEELDGVGDPELVGNPPEAVLPAHPTSVVAAQSYDSLPQPSADCSDFLHSRLSARSGMDQFARRCSRGHPPFRLVRLRARRCRGCRSSRVGRSLRGRSIPEELPRHRSLPQ